jgi:adenosine kinase
MLVITGTIAYDFIMDFPGKFGDQILPDQLHKINLSFIVNKFEKRRGGTAGNVCYSLGLLDTPSVLFAVMGTDVEEYVAPLSDLGVNTEHVLIDMGAYTATGFAMTDKTDNQIWGFFYGAAESTYKLKLQKITTKKDLVLIGPAGAKGSLSLVHQCVEREYPYMFDPGFILTQISNDDLAFGVTYAHYLIGNDYEISLIKSKLPNWEELFATKIVITTLGEKGALIEHKGKTYTILPAKPERVVDPTGAGDAWRSGFLAGIEKGFDLQTSGQMGSVAASFALEKYGTQEHTFTISAFKKRYRQTFNSVLSL